MTAHELELLWDERQSRYGMRRIAGVFRPLDEKEVNSVIAYRRQECQMLSPKERTVALVALAQWRPPQKTL